MQFNSWAYLVFLPCVCFFYYLLPHRTRWVLLLGASYFFYSCWNATYALLMLLSTAITYLSGICIEHFNDGSPHAVRNKRLCVAASFASNLGILFMFKYFNFLAGSLKTLLDLAGLRVSLPVLDLLLPVGISFYTFQALSYTADVYRGDVKCQRHFGKYALFVSFFPQLVAGPIERSSHLLEQFDEIHPLEYENIRTGILRIFLGMFKKVLIADRVAVVVDLVYNDASSYGGAALWLATALFTVQIYCDFSGYSDIAIGSARMLGFDLMQNFNAPYLANSIADFWRRWHISLSTWFRDYLYIPLGGNRVSRLRWAVNILIVFGVSGMWHGAAWTFIIWGLLHGIYQVVGKFTRPARDKFFALLHVPAGGKLRRCTRILSTLFLVCFTWMFFRANSMSDAVLILQRMFSPSAWGSVSAQSLGLDTPEIVLTVLLIAILFVCDLLGNAGEDCVSRIKAAKTPVRYAIYTALFFGLILFGYYGSINTAAFIYFQF